MCCRQLTKIDRADDDRILEVQDQVATLLGNAGREETRRVSRLRTGQRGRRCTEECSRVSGRKAGTADLSMAIFG